MLMYNFAEFVLLTTICNTIFEAIPTEYKRKMLHGSKLSCSAGEDQSDDEDLSETTSSTLFHVHCVRGRK
jgi:hypothetical protein